jgi:UDPglucose 6-dehydrogenase
MNNTAKNINITIVGSGYVGMSLAALLAKNNNIKVLDIDPAKVESINNNKSTISDKNIDRILEQEETNIEGTLNKNIAYNEADFIVVATPTDYNPETNFFDTSSVEAVIADIVEINDRAVIIIKSTLPIGYTKSLQEKYKTERIIFSPEFLRENHSLVDNLYPSRIIIGSHLKSAKIFCNLLTEAAEKENIECLYMKSTEAEAVKLFANTYLAMRVSFFNELDTFALVGDLDTKKIIEGLSLDNRIGQGYNNPSFGYGGYCLPKDTKQLLANYGSSKQSLIKAIVSSNEIRKDFISDEIINRKPKTVGFYKLAMKKDSDNFRSSAIQDVLLKVKSAGIKTILFEPSYPSNNLSGTEVIASFDEFEKLSDLIVANRLDERIEALGDKCFTRDVFGTG